MNMYVSNLSFHTTDEDLRNLFGQYGEVSSAKVITDRETGRSRGFGFVEMESNDAARAAITALHGSQLDGQTLTVNEANPVRGMGAPREDNRRPFTPTASSPSGDRPSSGGMRASGVRLFVGNLPYTATNAELEKLFAESGKVVSVSIMTDRATGQSKGFAFVDMGSKDEAAAAIKRFDGREALGRILKVNEARPPERRPGGFFGGGGGRR